ncbi:MAG: hypothetical protein ACK5AO_08615 [bacterium]
MTNQQEQLDAIKDIRNIMERSTRFLSLSGLSGAFVGLLSLLAVTIIYWLFDLNSANTPYYTGISTVDGLLDWPSIVAYFMVFGCVFLLSIVIVFLMAILNAKRQGLVVWNETAKRFLINMAIPLAIGGIYIAVLLYHGQIALILPSTIIFYGISLLNASKYSMEDIRLLAILELLIGLVASFFVVYGLLFWALGFGVLNIVFGLRVYFKYEK